jgi:hypothetical protein
MITDGYSAAFTGIRKVTHSGSIDAASTTPMIQSAREGFGFAIGVLGALCVAGVGYFTATLGYGYLKGKFTRKYVQETSDTSDTELTVVTHTDTNIQH